MVVRIVRMTFREDKSGEFLEVFNSSKFYIRSFPGCLHLELFQDADHPAVFITHSHWMGRESLEAYRASSLFAETWAKTKPLFAAKPTAFTMALVENVNPL